MSSPRQDAIDVVAGADLDEVYLIHDTETRRLVDWTDGDFEVTATIRDKTGQILATLSNVGSPDGEVELLSEGRLRLFLPGSVTAALPYTQLFTNVTDTRVVAYRHRRTHFLTVVAVETGSDDVSDLVRGSLTVHQPTT